MGVLTGKSIRVLALEKATLVALFEHSVSQLKSRFVSSSNPAGFFNMH